MQNEITTFKFTCLEHYYEQLKINDGMLLLQKCAEQFENFIIEYSKNYFEDEAFKKNPLII